MNERNLKIIFFILVFGFVSRITPHAANFAPIMALAVLANQTLSKRLAAISILTLILSTDLALAYLKGYPAFAGWSLFTYSWLLLITLLPNTHTQRTRCLNYLFVVLSSSIGFWVWTNLGVWLFSGIYQASSTGFMSCYFSALPFLRASLLNNLIWSVIIFYAVVNEGNQVLTMQRKIRAWLNHGLKEKL